MMRENGVKQQRSRKHDLSLTLPSAFSSSVQQKCMHGLGWVDGVGQPSYLGSPEWGSPLEQSASCSSETRVSRDGPD